MTVSYGDVPLIDPVTGRFPDAFAPPSVAAAVASTAQDAADAEAARVAAEALTDITVTTGAVVGDDLILTRTDATTVNAGNVRGATGPANSLAIGTVSTLAAGASATASVTGTAPSQTLNLGLPAGQPSDWLKVGPGDPRTPASTSGVITGTESNGCTYISTDGGGVGGYGWRKRAGVWVCVEGDSGHRTLVAWDAAGNITTGAFASAAWGPKAGQAGSIKIRRINNVVIWRFAWPTVVTVSQNGLVGIPTGFSAGIGTPSSIVTASSLLPWIMNFGGTFVYRVLGTQAIGDSLGHFHTQEVHISTSDAWPTTLPGIPA